MLSLENVAKIYDNPFIKNDRVLVLRGINLSVDSNDLTFIIGKSGAGKSTLLRLIAGVELPTTGRITFNDIQIEKLNKKNRILYWQKQIGIIYQEPMKNLIAELNVESNIRLPMKVLGQLNREQQKNRVQELLNFVGLQSYSKRKIKTLSGGEKQRIAVCVGIANDPEIILADEPTGELDSINAKTIINLLRSVIKSSNALGFIVTHNISLIEQGDKVYMMKNGLLTN